MFMLFTTGNSSSSYDGGDRASTKSTAPTPNSAAAQQRSTMTAMMGCSTLLCGAVLTCEPCQEFPGC